MTIKILNLLEHQQSIPYLAKLQYEEIGRHWVPDASISRAQERLITHLNRNKLPLAVVALEDDKPVGMACLRETDGIQPGVCPWLGSLVVDPKFRAKGVGQLLIEAIKSHARELKYEILYLLAFDPTIPSWYASLGWEHTGFDELFGHRVTVMSIKL